MGIAIMTGTMPLLIVYVAQGPDLLALQIASFLCQFYPFLFPKVWYRSMCCLILLTIPPIYFFYSLSLMHNKFSTKYSASNCLRNFIIIQWISHRIYSYINPFKRLCNITNILLHVKVLILPPFLVLCPNPSVNRLMLRFNPSMSAEFHRETPTPIFAKVSLFFLIFWSPWCINIHNR